jgi:hypothetical protein
MRALAAALPAVVAACAVLALPVSALAMDRAQGFGLDTGLAMLSISGESPQTGIAYGLHYKLALTDQFDFAAELGGAVVDLNPKVSSSSPTDRPTMLFNGDVGVLYKLDIVQFVPYFGALVGGYSLVGGSLPSAKVLPGGELAAGADYLLSRRWAVGLAIREHFLFTDLGTYPSYLTVTARVEMTWGEF